MSSEKISKLCAFLRILMSANENLCFCQSLLNNLKPNKYGNQRCGYSYEFSSLCTTEIYSKLGKEMLDSIYWNPDNVTPWATVANPIWKAIMTRCHEKQQKLYRTTGFNSTNEQQQKQLAPSIYRLTYIKLKIRHSKHIFSSFSSSTSSSLVWIFWRHF